jgi:sialic acid synthase SpsE
MSMDLSDVASLVGRLAERRLALGEQQRRLTEAQRHTEEKLNALIAVVNGIIRRPPAS